MPSIKIFEEDLTKGGGRSTNLNVVYVPGFMSTDTGESRKKPGAWPWVEERDEDGKVVKLDGEPKYVPGISNAPRACEPRLCSTITEFEMYFGTEPATYTGANGKKCVDKSYIYAKELIANGLPVLYESMNSVHSPDEVEVCEATMLASLETAYDKLYDRGEYQVKYLTSGGYPNFGVSYSYEAMSKVVTTDTQTEHILSEEVKTHNDFTIDNTTVFSYDGLNERGSHKWVTNKDGKVVICTESIEGGIITLYTSSVDGTGKITVTPILSFSEPENTDTREFIRVKDSKYCTKLIFEVDAEDTITCKWAGVKNTEEKLTTLTNSDHPNSIAISMAKLTTSDSKEGESKSRGDCVALIDHIDDADVPLSGNGSIYESVKTQFMSLDGADGCAMFTPWVNMNFTTYDKTLSMPGSFAYLMSLAKSLRTNPSWLAIAGATRGQIPNLDGDTPLNLNKTLTNAIAESYQNRDGISINAITNIKPFGYRIWGNRTLKNNSVEGNLTATSFLNTKTMVCDVKKVVWDACRKYMFEQNNDVLWLNFKSYIEPTLNQMKTGAGLSGYKIIKGTTTEKAKLVATIKLYPLYAVEDFEVTVQMLDDEIAVS